MITLQNPLGTISMNADYFAELVSLALTLFFLLRVKKTIIHPLVEKARQAAA